MIINQIIDIDHSWIALHPLLGNSPSRLAIEDILDLLNRSLGLLMTVSIKSDGHLSRKSLGMDNRYTIRNGFIVMIDGISNTANWLAMTALTNVNITGHLQFSLLNCSCYLSLIY
jgi:hypothetical protein